MTLTVFDRAQQFDRELNTAPTPRIYKEAIDSPKRVCIEPDKVRHEQTAQK
jgi:hypothetical protein